ncbi:hypothetical protein [Absidia glauca]|uniref:BZIP domain-containing protein n=1 Tax=Absidia glauca TaxID=4829 RepID=A0A168Q2K2_ABSGL|nr:hypothetical protein [Absidia glauca]
MTQQLRPKTILPSFRPIAPSLTPTNTSWTVNAFENRKRESSGTNDSPAKHFQNSDGGYTTNPTFDTSSGKGRERRRQTLTADQRARRKEQNRQAQRAFRQRKEGYVKELETKIKMMEKSHAQALAAVEQDNKALRDKVRELEKALGRQSTVNSQPDHDNAIAMATSALEVTTIDDTPTNPSPTSDSTYQQDQPMDNSDNSSTTKSNHGFKRTAVYSSSSSSSPFSPAASRIIMPSSAVACIRDKDGVSFCERLKEEVCSSAYNQLLSEPLFDATGSLNETVTSHPVPIVTDRMDEDDGRPSMDDNDDDQHRFDMYDDPMYFLDRLTETLATERFDLSSPHPDTLTPDIKLIPCSRVWQTLSAHPKFDAFDVDLLCDELKKIAKCSGTGPVFTEHELNALVQWMETQTDQVS